MVFGDDDALSSSESVSFDDDWVRSGAEIFNCRLGVIEIGGGSRRNVVF